MKKLLFILFTLFARTVLAQGFEGTIKWSMKMEITDPKMKAQMDASQKQMNDPAQQAKMKQMQDQMNDPKMKAMLESNPALKAQMENLMKMTQGGDIMNNMTPKEMILKVKGTNTLVTMVGGMMQGDFLHTLDKSVFLDRDKKTYSVMPPGNIVDKDAKPKITKTTITKTTETTKILGYTCTKYIIETTENDKTTTSYLWATTDIPGFDTKALAKQRLGQSQSLFYESIDGITLRNEIITPQSKMTMEVTEIKRESINAADFTIPSGYTETKGMFGK